MGYEQITLNDWIEMKEKLKRELLGVKQSFVRIGYVLRQMDDQKLYEQDGYKSIAEFAKAEYGLESSTVSRFMSINKEYSIDGYSEQLRPEYAELGRSQLEEMLKLPETDRQMIQPETPREDIRELKRFNKTEPEAGIADDIRELVEMFFKSNREALNRLYESGTMEENQSQRIDIVNPSGNRTFKKGLYFMMMYEKDIKIKKFGGNPETLDWTEFFDIARDIFDEMAAGSMTWEAYFGEEILQEEEKPEVKTSEPVQKKPETKKSEQKPVQKEEKKEEPLKKLKAPDTAVTEPEKEEEKLVAPAQFSRQNLEKNEVSEEKKEEEKSESQELTDTPFGTRKDYLDTLTEHGMADYMAAEYRRGNLKATILEHASELETWLMCEVDDRGREIVDI